MFLVPVKQVLRGISFESSDFDKNPFYVNAFVLPFCVSTKHLYFNFGNRLRQVGGGDRWHMDVPNLIEALATNLKREALPFLLSSESLTGFAEAAKSFSFKNPHTPQAAAYALIRFGDFQSARPVLTEFRQQLDLNIPWQREMADRAQSLIRILDVNPPDATRWPMAPMPSGISPGRIIRTGSTGCAQSSSRCKIRGRGPRSRRAGSGGRLARSRRCGQIYRRYKSRSEKLEGGRSQGTGKFFSNKMASV